MKYVVLYFLSSISFKCRLTKLTSFFSWQKIHPVDSEYREGREFEFTEFIKEGSYGEVHSAQDVNTGFKFAVKKVSPTLAPSLFCLCLVWKCTILWVKFSSIVFTQIPLKMFISEEVGAWSALKSPRVVELFGVVREGPNVYLFMDQKAGKQASFVPDRTHTMLFI